MGDFELPENLSESQREEFIKHLDNLSQSERDAFEKKYRESFMGGSDLNKHLEEGKRLVEKKDAELRERIEKSCGGKISYKDVLNNVIEMLDKEKTASQIENSLRQKYNIKPEDCTGLTGKAIIARQLKKEEAKYAPKGTKKG